MVNPTRARRRKRRIQPRENLRSRRPAATGPRSGWRKGAWPKGIRTSKTRPGHCAGRARSVRWSGYVRQRDGIGRCGSPRSCTTSTNPAMLREAYFRLKREAAPGVDRVTWRQYGRDLEGNLLDLSGRLKRGAYRAKPVRRVFISKTDGRPAAAALPSHSYPP